MTDIFISYSHKDEAWKDALKQQLQVLQLHAEFSIWDDRQIEVGANWLPAIKTAIAQAKVVILLISSDFLASEFVTKQEVPDFLKLREQKGLHIVPVIVRPCAWWTVPWLSALQGATKDNKPLSQYPLGSYQLEVAFSEITGTVHDLLIAAKQAEAQRQAEEQARLERERQQREAQEKQIAEQKRLAEEKAAHEAEVKRLAEEKAAREAERRRQAEEARLAKQREDHAAQQALVLEQEKQKIKAQRIETLTQKHSALYQDHDLETRSEEKLRLKHEIEKVELELAELGVASPVSSVKQSLTSSEPEAQPTIVTKPDKIDIAATSETGLNKWLLSGIVLAVLGGGVWWNKYRIDSSIQTILPELVDIPAGTFTMGCLPERDLVQGIKKCLENELPAHEVKVRAFQIGKYEVTFDEWDACEQRKACPHAEDEGWGRGRRPVINVSWNDIQIYLKWLKQQTGKEYRLPTEAEWEYAARGGKDGAYPWGTNKIDCQKARYGWIGEECNDSDKTVEVGSYKPNGYGLYDTAGNVWEWTQDHYTVSYGATEQSVYVLRGGSWGNESRNVRSAYRDFSSGSHYDVIGFRLVLGY